MAGIKNGPVPVSYACVPGTFLLKVSANQFGHFKHADLLFTKDWAQFIVGIDIATVLRVL